MATLNISNQSILMNFQLLGMFVKKR